MDIKTLEELNSTLKKMKEDNELLRQEIETLKTPEEVTPEESKPEESKPEESKPEETEEKELNELEKQLFSN